MSLIENTTQLSQSVLFQESLTMYGAFGLFTLVLVALDIYQTRGGAITMQKAIVWSIFWFLLAFLLQVPSISFGTFTLLIVLTAMRKRPCLS